MLAALALAGCARGPDAGFVKESVQQQLDAALGGRVLTVESLRPSGGTALKGGDGRVVYFNARMKLARDYDFTQWNAHSVASLGALLGAGPKGLIGLKADGNKAGDEIDVFGTAAFARRDGRYEQVALTPSAAAPDDAAAGRRRRRRRAAAAEGGAAADAAGGRVRTVGGTARRRRGR